MDATSSHPPPEVTVDAMPNLSEIIAIEALLSRLDPEPRACTVPGCLHLHGVGDTGEGVTALAA
jgi:hypothetical protein